MCVCVHVCFSVHDISLAFVFRPLTRAAELDAGNALYAHTLALAHAHARDVSLALVHARR